MSDNYEKSIKHIEAIMADLRRQRRMVVSQYGDRSFTPPAPLAPPAPPVPPAPPPLAGFERAFQQFVATGGLDDTRPALSEDYERTIRQRQPVQRDLCEHGKTKDCCELCYVSRFFRRPGV